MTEFLFCFFVSQPESEANASLRGLKYPLKVLHRLSYA